MKVQFVHKNHQNWIFSILAQKLTLNGKSLIQTYKIWFLPSIIDEGLSLGTNLIQVNKI